MQAGEHGQIRTNRVKGRASPEQTHAYSQYRELDYPMSCFRMSFCTICRDTSAMAAALVTLP